MSGAVSLLDSIVDRARNVVLVRVHYEVAQLTLCIHAVEHTSGGCFLVSVLHDLYRLNDLGCAALRGEKNLTAILGQNVGAIRATYRNHGSGRGLTIDALHNPEVFFAAEEVVTLNIRGEDSQQNVAGLQGREVNGTHDTWFPFVRW